MRRVPLSMISADMQLAVPIYHKNRLLLKEGTGELNRYIGSLKQLGITSVYIKDELGQGIEIDDAVSEKARVRCKEALNSTIVSLQTNGSIQDVDLVGSINYLLDEILNRKDILISLIDIGTTDDNTLVHSVNMTIYALLIGKRLGYSRLQMQRLAEGCILHDIGKVLLDSNILYKPDKLTNLEYEYVKQHTTKGYELLKRNPIMTELSRIICLSHHERLDGSGYPHALKRDEIHEFARIAAIADVYDAVTSERCYHKEKSVFEAVNILMQEACMKRLDAELIALFLKDIAVYPNGSLIKLSDETYAVVKDQNPEMPFRPIVRVFDPWEQVPLYEVNLMEDLSTTIVSPNVISIENLKNDLTNT